ncbi:MAG: endonuclease/exonuclease/phosphatase family protein, partial [Bdellovibrionales bacterium]|nr:endonuclease/exonuclease/phosphatase family protein [Bdellovibrionales bacterium]
TYTIINVHLEVGGKAPFTLIQAAQMQELVRALATEPLPTILIGDFNSAPTDPTSQPYHQALAAGFVDLWDRTHPFLPGFTCCQDADLENKTGKLNMRIDHLFVRNNLNGRLPFSIVGLAEVSLLGENPDDMVFGLWPSDHAGVAARINLPFVQQ